MSVDDYQQPYLVRAVPTWANDWRMPIRSGSTRSRVAVQILLTVHSSHVALGYRPPGPLRDSVFIYRVTYTKQSHVAATYMTCHCILLLGAVGSLLTLMHGVTLHHRPPPIARLAPHGPAWHRLPRFSLLGSETRHKRNRLTLCRGHCPPSAFRYCILDNNPSNLVCDRVRGRGGAAQHARRVARRGRSHRAHGDGKPRREALADLGASETVHSEAAPARERGAFPGQRTWLRRRGRRHASCLAASRSGLQPRAGGSAGPR